MTPSTWEDLKSDMESGRQTKGISFWEHGSMVAERFIDLMDKQKLEWRLPKWFIEHSVFILEKLQPDLEPIVEYQQWHDLGKPYCRTVDEDGRVHYPNHAEVSCNIWRDLGGDPFIGELIRDDMLCHTLRASDAPAFAKNRNAIILLTTALCELHANSEMFGGLESDSFKIKFKRLEKLGNSTLKLIKEQL